MTTPNDPGPIGTSHSGWVDPRLKPTTGDSEVAWINASQFTPEDVLAVLAERQRLQVALDLLWGELNAEQYHHVREHYPDVADLCVEVHREVSHGGT